MSWSVLLSQYNHEDIKNKNVAGCLALPLAELITKDEDLFQKLTWGTNAKLNHQVAFRAANNLINQNLK